MFRNHLHNVLLCPSRTTTARCFSDRKHGGYNAVTNFWMRARSTSTTLRSVSDHHMKLAGVTGEEDGERTLLPRRHPLAYCSGASHPTGVHCGSHNSSSPEPPNARNRGAHVHERHTQPLAFHREKDDTRCDSAGILSGLSATCPRGIGHGPHEIRAPFRNG